MSENAPTIPAVDQAESEQVHVEVKKTPSVLYTVGTLFLFLAIFSFGILLLPPEFAKNMDGLREKAASVYVNPTLQYKILIPQGFTSAENYWGKDTLIIWDGPTHKGYPVYTYPFVGIKIDPLGKRVIDPGTAEFKSALFKEGNVQIFKPVTLKNNRSAYLLEYTDTLNSDFFRSRYMLVVKDGILYRVGVRAILNDWKKSESDWIKIIDSFEI